MLRHKAESMSPDAIKILVFGTNGGGSPLLLSTFLCKLFICFLYALIKQDIVVKCYLYPGLVEQIS